MIATRRTGFPRKVREQSVAQPRIIDKPYRRMMCLKVVGAGFKPPPTRGRRLCRKMVIEVSLRSPGLSPWGYGNRTDAGCFRRILFLRSPGERADSGASRPKADSKCPDHLP